jgi:hypothetical protein
LARPLLDRAATEPVDLRPVRRWENEAVASNVRSWLASLQAPAERPPPYPYVCECGRRGCCERVPLTLAEYDASPRVVAHGHSER